MIFLPSTYIAFGQTDTLRTKGRRTIPSIIGKWKLDSLTSKTMHQTLLGIEFYENGEYKETSDFPITGNWKMENGQIIKQAISTENPVPAETQIIVIESLTMRKLVYSEYENKKKMFLYFSKMDYKSPTMDVIPH